MKRISNLNEIFNNFILKIFLILFGLVFYASGEQIQNHLTECCAAGTKWAIEKTDCQDYNYAIGEIPPVWRGLCLSTFGMCCSKELQNQHCLAGRHAAKTGSNCDVTGKFDTPSYENCCKACQIGLAVAASGNDCSSSHFDYFTKDESFLICCNDVNNNNNNNSERDDSTSVSTVSTVSSRSEHDRKHSNLENDDGTFVLTDTDDICTKFNTKLCSQVCENTKDSYVCKCFEGYKLDENRVTCSPKVVDSNDDDFDDDDIDDGIDDDDDDRLIDENECQKGYKRNEITKVCEDIDECNLGMANKCSSNEYCYNTIGSYTCMNIKSTVCQDGYRFNAKTEECEDINECLEDIDDCNDFNHVCINIRGGYLCQLKETHGECMLGYRYNRRKRRCEDYDECEDNPCENGYVCINFPAHYECREIPTTRTPQVIVQTDKCGPGYHYKHNKCIDIDECLTDKNACDNNQLCTNEHGGYRCDCKIGFKMDSTLHACVDINECQINNHNCLQTQRCDNTIGSYTCIRLQGCGTGYTLNSETNNCDDDDECELKTHDCPMGYDCRNTMGSFRCDRKRHTTPRRITTPRTTRTSSPTPSTTSTSTSTTTTTTTTVRPYIQRPSYPSENYNLSARSQPNINPTYVSDQTYSKLNSDYIPTSTHRFRVETPCGRGFQRNHMGACVDIDECRNPNTCGSHQKCINSNGSYRCQNLLQCSGGYKSSPDGGSCVDIDECITNEHNCGPEQLCRNRIGGYICSCPPGHLLSSTNRCVDINECEHQVCPINSNCINTIGSYYCECKPGFRKQNENENTCVDIDECQDIPGLCEQKCINFWGSYRCACSTGFELNMNNNRSCDDINECEVHKSYKLCMGFCNNVPGSYECSCPPGYELGTDKNSCRDIDECTTTNECTGSQEICTNIRGSYKCTSVQCPHGYVHDPDQKNRCRVISNMCEGDECHQKPSSYTFNFITLVSNMMIPPQGRTLFSLRGPSWYENIDFDLKLAQTQAPVGVEKATLHHFSTIKMHNQVQLNLMRSLEGPQEIELELSMTVFMNGQPRGKSIAKLFLIVSRYSF